MMYRADMGHLCPSSTSVSPTYSYRDADSRIIELLEKILAELKRIPK
jgi:hypothetical protein